MNKNSKFALQASDKSKNTNYNLPSPLKNHVNSAISIAVPKRDYYYNREYLEINQFKVYRDLMLRKIDAEQINNSFSEIRQLISSFKEAVFEPKESNYQYNGFNKNTKITSPSVLNSSPYDSDQTSSLIKGSPVSVSRLKGKKARKDQVSKLLTNLHIYINNNLTEINELKSSIKTSKIEQNFSNSNMPRIDLFDSQIQKSSVGQEEQTASTLQIEDPILLTEKKVHKIEVEKLLSKIKTINEREKKIMEKMEILKHDEKTIQNNINMAVSMIKTRISGFVHEDVWNSESDKRKFFMSLMYESYVLLITKSCLYFFKSLNDEKESLLIDSSSISDVCYYKKEAPIDLNSSEASDNEQDFSSEEESFNGFQIKFNTKNYLFLKIHSFLDMLKLDNYFFLTNIMKTNQNIDFFFKFSRTCYANSMNIIHDAFEKNYSPSIKRGNASPSMTDLDISNISNNQNEKRLSLTNKHDSEKLLMKKKSIFHQTNENLNKKFKTTTVVESIPFDQREKSRPVLFESKTKLSSFRDNDIHSQFTKRNSFIEKKDPYCKYLKAMKSLKNGFLFLKYGKYGDPYERLVYLSEKNALEWRDINKKKSNGCLDIKLISEINENLNIKQFKKGNIGVDNIENNIFCIVAKNQKLIFEGGSAKLKRDFIDSLKLIMNSPEVKSS